MILEKVTSAQVYLAKAVLMGILTILCAHGCGFSMSYMGFGVRAVGYTVFALFGLAAFVSMLIYLVKAFDRTFCGD